MIRIDGKYYKHISEFDKAANTLRQWIWRQTKKGKPPKVVKLRSGYYIQVDKKTGEIISR